MKNKIGQIYKIKNYNAFIRIIDIYPPNRYGYSSLKKELLIKTNATIIKYQKSTDINFMVGTINFMKLSDFNKNFLLLSTN